MMEAPLSATSRLRRSVFWKVAAVLVGVQVATALLAVALSAWFTYDRSLDLVTNSLRLRLDGLAEEIEQRAAPLAAGLDSLPPLLVQDLDDRFPDPVTLVDASGRPVRSFAPDQATFAVDVDRSAGALPAAAVLADTLAGGSVVVHLSGQGGTTSWGLAPLYDADGFLAGGVLVHPLSASVSRELSGTRAAYARALMVTAALAVLIALLLGALFTWRLVRPIRQMTHQVERIEAGDYAVRVPVAGGDELGRLGAGINRMAAAVEESVERLRRTDRLRRELVANVGHDLRTPLSALLGYLEEATRFVAEGRYDDGAAAVATAERQGRYIHNLVEDLFELAVLDSAATPLREEMVPAAELLRDAANAHRAAFDRAGITFETVVPPSLPVIRGDGVRLLRVLDNLLANARRHTPQGGTVRMSASAEGNTLVVLVEDTGEGMAPDVLERVFDRYYRGSGARTRHTEGTGLGLAIARAIARAHGGALTASSVEGAGSVFRLELPRRV